MSDTEIENLQKYLLKQDSSRAIYGISRADIQKELLLTEREADKYLGSRKMFYSIYEFTNIYIKLLKDSKE